MRCRRQKIERFGFYLLAEPKNTDERGRSWRGMLFSKDTYAEASLWFTAETETMLEKKALLLIRQYRTA